jgi:hypothetical protein
MFFSPVFLASSPMKFLITMYFADTIVYIVTDIIILDNVVFLSWGCSVRKHFKNKNPAKIGCLSMMGMDDGWWVKLDQSRDTTQEKRSRLGQHRKTRTCQMR